MLVKYWSGGRRVCRTCSYAPVIIEQSPSYSPETKMKQRRAKANARSSRRQRDTRTATELSNRLPQKLQRAMKTSAEKGASTWLATLPIAEHGFALHKQAGAAEQGGQGGDRPPKVVAGGFCPPKVLPAWMRMHGDLVWSTVGAV